MTMEIKSKTPQRHLRPLIKIISLVGLVISVGCATKVLEVDQEKVQQMEENREYDNLIKVEQLPDEESGQAALEEQAEKTTEEKKPEEAKPDPKKDKKPKVKKAPPKKKTPKKTVTKKDKKKKMTQSKKRQPEHEDSENFNGRRPLVDPFRVGEKVRFSMTYFNITAGYMDLMVKPFVQVNGKKAYHFEVDIKSSTFFNRIYAVDDKATTYLDYETLLPFNLDIRVRESKQIKEIRSFLDNEKLVGSYWEKKVTKEKGEQEKSVKWDIKPYSQNVISAVYYLRAFTLKPGKELAFRVADDGKNYMFKGKVLRKEKLKTEIGKLDTIVVKPEISIGGVFKPTGDILIWLTDDDRKFPVRIESKIKIGTIIAKLKSLEPGIREK